MNQEVIEGLKKIAKALAKTFRKIIIRIVKEIKPIAEKFCELTAKRINSLNRKDYKDMGIKGQLGTLMIAKDLREAGYKVQELPPGA